MHEKTIQNAIIGSYSLDINDHGSLDLWLYLKYSGGVEQGFGGYVLYLPPGFKHHAIQSPAGHYIYRCMKIAGITKVKDFPGRAIRAAGDFTLGGKIEAIGHIIEDDWFNPSTDLK